jgi:hypothetical protein
MSRIFNPVYSSTSDGSDITLCRILEAAGSIKDAIAGGGGGGATSANPAVGPDGVTRVPLNVNADGELKVNVEASVDADLAQIENKLDTIIGIATPQAADVASINTEAQAIDNKLPALSSGRIPVEANNAASQVYNYTATGAVALNTVLIGPIDCSQFRETSIQCTSIGASSQIILQLSNDNSLWVNSNYVTPTGSITQSFSTVGFFNYPLQNAKFFRVVQSTAQTAGTTTIVAYASQQATPKLYQSVTGSVSTVSGSVITPIPNVGLGMALYHSLVSAASTNATSVKGSQGVIGTLILTNSSATWAYFKLVNKASAPTVGTDTAIINIGVAPNTTQDCSTSFAGLRMTTGIAYYVSGGPSLTDNTALLAAGTFLVNMTYV